MHFHNFLAKYNTIMLNWIPANNILMQLFLFSLKDKASDWLYNEQLKSFTMWDAFSKAFLSKYFLLGKTTKQTMNVISFTQHDGESSYEA